MWLIAKKSLRYGGRELKVGDEFEASTRDGKILRAVRKADLIQTAAADEAAAPKPKRRGPAGRGGQMQFQGRPTAEPLTTESGAGTYGRRDMRAED